ncbi:hypothetical protein MKEN_00069600 [Mycena kentingensis (nom. inval.)]|nr:hypothetical protein MKEN_00069600 [Mycena kentingensis (nom. inval.)]
MHKQQRRMTAPAGSLQPPDGGNQPNSNRPPSPLRNGYLPNSTSTGIDPDILFSATGDHEDEHERWRRSPSPAPSSVSHVSQMAASFIQSFLAPKSPGIPADEEEAALERDRSRREAERILSREAEGRQQLEQRVLALMENTKSLPPPPSRSQSMDPPSPASSQKEGGGWWTAAKNRLTPNKELTAAQQVIQETKARDKAEKKGKGKEKEWPAKYSNPSYTSLLPPSRQQMPGQSPPTTPSTTPSRPQNSNMPPNLTPSPMRHEASREKEAPPLYAQFDETTSTLDVPATLLMIAKRFEKLEKWTVGHVRALEDRMGDVERWLVDKEKAKEEVGSSQKEEDSEGMAEIREGMHELQSRVGSLGREIAKLATAPANLSQTTQARYPAEISASPNTPSSSFAIQGTSPRVVSGHTARESTSPPMRSNSTSSTRLPYPSGDYSSPPESMLASPDVFTASPSAIRPVSGLPSSLSSSASTSYSNATFSSTSSISVKPSELPVPKATSRVSGRGSVSPTPRKRYTVALGGSASSDSESAPEIGTAMFSSSDKEDFDGGDTIGKSAAAKLTQKSPKEPRTRAQSAYGLSSIMQASPNTVSSLAERRPSPMPHGRSKSIDRFGTGSFVDPLVLRKQTSRDTTASGKPLGAGKPVAQMVAFFDKA